MEDKDLQEELMELDLVKNHLREASMMLQKMSMRHAKNFDMKDREAFARFMNSHNVKTKARDCISMALFTLKNEIVELYWNKEIEDDVTFKSEGSSVPVQQDQKPAVSST